MMQLDVSEAAEELKLSRVDNQPWGFRVTGGLDFGTPLTVIKVQARSLAELAGLKVGDMLLKANGQPLSYLTHHESYKYLQECGNFVALSVVRGSLVMPPALTPSEPLNESKKADENETDNKVKEQNENSEEVQNVQPPPPREPSLFETIFGPLDEPPTERCKSAFEELVDELTQKQGQEQGQDIPPDSQTEQQTVTVTETDNVIPETEAQKSEEPQQEVPDNSISAAATATAAAVVSAAVAAASAVENATAALAAADASEAMATPEAVAIEESSKQVEESEQQILNEEIKKEVTEEELQEIMLGHAEVLKGKAIGVNFEKMILPNSDVIEQSQVLQVLKEDSTEAKTKKLSTFLIPPDRPKIKPKEKPKKPKEVPKQPEATPESNPCQENKENNEGQPVNQQTDENSDTQQPATNEEHVQQESTENAQQSETAEENEITKGEKEGEEVKEQSVEVETAKEPEDKLVAIQNQLLALLQLPAVMQQQLSVLQQEISNIVQQKLEPTEAAEEENREQTEGEAEALAQDESQKGETAGDEKVNPDNEETNQVSEGEHDSNTLKDQEDTNVEEAEKDTTNTTDGQEPSTESQVQEVEALENIDETQPEERKKDIKWQHEKPKKNKPFFPLTPLPRSIVLPGRKKFQVNPVEAYNDEFIAETLSGNAEIITGTTIGINFMKYAPHRTYDHLKKSSVYRMVHESENTGEGGFMARQEKLLAAEDYISNEDLVLDV